MPLVLLVAVLLFVVLFAIVSIPFGIILRYRGGTARRRARWWIVTLNFYGATLSLLLLIVSASVSTVWIAHALPYTLCGVVAGIVLGAIGLALTRWEESHRALHYTPSRLLILLITIVVVARIGYGFWRAWHAWEHSADTASWLAASGASGSMAAGAAVLAYYVVYWIGVRRRINGLQRRTG